MNIWHWINSREGRKWLYAVALAVLAILTAYDIIADEMAPLWINLIGAILGIGAAGMALNNLPPKEDPHDGLNLPSDIVEDMQ